MKNTLKLKLQAVSFAAVILSSSSQAAVIFDFADGGSWDGVTAGTSMSVTNAGDTVVMTSISITAPDFNDADPYNNLITTDNETNIANNSGAGGLGINNDTTGNTAFNTLTGAGSSESSNINYLESITFEFDQTVIMTTIDLASIANSGEFLRINIEGDATDYDLGGGFANDIYPDPLSGLVITAGTDITFTGLGGEGATNFRVDEFTVEVVPEPSSTALLGLGGLALLMRRRK